jgi:hypothetical protein
VVENVGVFGLTFKPGIVQTCRMSFRAGLRPAANGAQRYLPVYLLDRLT